MKKSEQEKINAMVLDVYKDFMNERGIQFISRLRSCSADVYASDKYYVLKSYNTVIAVADSRGNVYDFLRYVYGYTATSAQHITKFARDYGNGTVYRYYDI